MKQTLSLPSALSLLALAGSLVIGVSSAQAGTVAWWRFENGTAGTQVTHLSGANGVWSADIPDSSGNGNALSAWTGDGWAGYAYKSDVASSTASGSANTLSVQNTGGYPGMWNNTLRTWTPTSWTIEATFKPETGGWRTIVGRDSIGAGTQNGANSAESALYFQMRPDNSVGVTFQDVNGYRYSAVSSANLISGFNFTSDPNGTTGTWYSMAAVSDGKTLSVYLNNLTTDLGYQLVATADLTAQGSSNTALTAGLGSGGDWTAGDFSVGRGLYNGGHGDRAYGFIDEVRFSDTALTVDQFLVVPEPTTVALALLGGLLLAGRRLGLRR